MTPANAVPFTLVVEKLDATGVDEESGSCEFLATEKPIEDPAKQLAVLRLPVFGAGYGSIILALAFMSLVLTPGTLGKVD